MVRDIEEWRPGFYTNIRCGRREHGALACGLFFWKNCQISRNEYLLKMDMSKNSRNRIFRGTEAPQGASRQKGAFKAQKGKI